MAEEEAKTETKEKKKKGFNFKVILIGLPLFIVQLVLVYFITATFLVKSAPSSHSEKDGEQVEEASEEDAEHSEPQKIFNDRSFSVTATAVRIPTAGGHSESVNVEFENDFDLTEVRRLLSEASGVVVQDNPDTNTYPMPIYAHGKDDVFVGRIRRDETQRNTLNMWIVADNLRKGAATNAIQIAEYLVENHLV